jgi:hypothetical protein
VEASEAEAMTWFRVVSRFDPSLVVNACHYCAIVATDDEMQVEYTSAPNDLGRGETLNCDCCGRLIAHGPRL